MGKNGQYLIALVLYTQGLDYDDRIRKEMLSVMALFPSVSFKVFAVEPKNREEEGVTSYGISYRIPYLRTRDKYPSSSHTLAKALDFYKSVNKDLQEFDAIWCADIETFPFVLLTRGKPILWDHHELPLFFVSNPLKKTLFKYLERKVKVMIHANQARLNYLTAQGMINHPEKQYILRNYPQFNEIDSEYDETYHSFKKWLNDKKCVYLQGVVDEKRADVESIEAVLSVPGLKAVVVGKTRPELQDILLLKHSENELSERLFFTGRIKQLKTPQYIRKCFMSLAFYKNVSPNNWYCEPNRLFQNLINGNPVVVGNNPPMKEIVEKYGVGVCASTDGSNVEAIISAIKKVIMNHDRIKQNIATNEKQWLWNQQDTILREIVEKLLK